MGNWLDIGSLMVCGGNGCWRHCFGCTWWFAVMGITVSGFKCFWFLFSGFCFLLQVAELVGFWVQWRALLVKV